MRRYISIHIYFLSMNLCKYNMCVLYWDSEQVKYKIRIQCLITFHSRFTVVEQTKLLAYVLDKIFCFKVN